jgi:hypothetical protein
MVEKVSVRSGDHRLLTSRGRMGRQVAIGPCAVRIPCPAELVDPGKKLLLAVQIHHHLHPALGK